MDELIDYVTESPENTNPNVVRSLASQIPAGGGNSEIFVVNLTYDESIAKFISDKTAREVINAAEAGMMVFVKWKYKNQYGESTFYTYLLTSYSDTIINILDLRGGNYQAYYENLDDYLVFDFSD